MDKKKEDELLDDHNYDGIQEYDNPMPRWWVNLFWATIVFSVFYCIYYMLGFGPSHLDEYQQELSVASAKTAPSGDSSASEEQSILEQLVKGAKSEATIASGKSIFGAKCMMCHGDKAQGLIGPNLTDEQWIHGGSLEEIFHIVNVGVAEKGMIPWEGQLSLEERIAVVAFIRSIQGTNIPGKAPEGEIAAATSLE